MRLVDLTTPIEENMTLNSPKHPRAPLIWLNRRHEFSQWHMLVRWDPPRIPPLFDGLPPEAGMPGKGHGVQSQQLIISTHLGTHIDASLHLDHRAEGEDISQVPLERCCGDAIMLDLRDVCCDNYAITVADLDRALARTSDSIRTGDIVILHTGHSAKYGYGPGADREKWGEKYPGLGYDAAAWFIERKVKLVGIDSPNLDCDLALATHVNFLLRGWIGKDVINIVENLVNLEQVPASRFTFMALPLPIVSGDGSPVRAVAIL